MGVVVGPGRPVRRVRPDTYLFFLASFALIVFLTHLPYLGLPFYWDELGQFIPAALDIFREGRWIPHSTIPNVHPPAVMAYLAGVWHVAGYSIEATRAAMLLVASASVLVVFLLAIQLCRGARGAPAFLAVVLVLVSPLFYTQAMMAQLDMPAMLLTLWALLWFLQGRFLRAALVSTLLVLVKETGVVVPVVFGVWLWRCGRRREAWYSALPVAALSVWLIALRAVTGHWLGNAAFTEYNALYPLHPVRAGAALLRRAYYLLAGDFRWIGWIAVAAAWRRTRAYAHEAWRMVAVLAVAHVLLVSLLGGATLERYLLPVLPLAYIAMAAAWSAAPSRWTRVSQAALIAGLLLSLFVNPPYPFPYENNLAMVDSVRLEQAAARYLERNCGGRTVTTAWPFSAALRRPEYGYVEARLPVREIAGFDASHVAALPPDAAGVFVLYSREWDSPLNFWRLPEFRALQRRYYGWQPQITPEELERRFGLTEAARWRRGGQWIAVYIGGR